MARPMHVHRSVRRANLAAHKISLRAAKAPAKAKARVNRQARIAAKIAATPADVALAPEVLSFVSAKLGKPAAKITREEAAAAVK